MTRASEIEIASAAGINPGGFVFEEIETHFTGYYEPEFEAALIPGGRYKYPIHKLPSDPMKARASRRGIEVGNLLRGSEIAWLSDPLDVFFLQVQGSGRLQLPEGATLRVGFAGKNGHDYVSIGRHLIESDQIPADKMSPEAIRKWCRTYPSRVQELLWQNPSYVFFQTLDLDPSLGPLGAQGVPLTPKGSIAVDPERVPLGRQVWVETSAVTGLMVAEDIGSAIKGARADVFFGTGRKAGRAAGRMNEMGRMVVLHPKELNET